MGVDLLVFGPHPDDLEIGLGGTIARHVGQGLQVGLCDLTLGELGSTGTVEERLSEAHTACLTLGAAWRENLGWPDRQIGRQPEQLDQAVEYIRRHRPRVDSTLEPSHALLAQAAPRRSRRSRRRTASSPQPFRAR